MAKILIACNNDYSEDLHHFFQSCADIAKQHCVDNNHTYTFVDPPFLIESNVIPQMQNHQLCFIVAHGGPDGIYNESGNDVISTHTTNYVFANKGLYTISCSCFQNLYLELHRLGLKLFVGYNTPFYLGEDEDAFCDCAIEGLKHILKGETKAMAHKAMLDKFDKVIESLPFFDKNLLLRNKESLRFEGEDNISINELV